MEAMNVVEARRNFSELVTRVAYGGSRVVVERRGRSLAALISVQDLEKLQVWEREHDTVQARQQAALFQARAVRAAILAERGGALLPDSTELIRADREERYDELAGVR
jgi:prevent-host-death family protein